MSRRVDHSSSRSEQGVSRRTRFLSTLLLCLSGAVGCGLQWNIFATPVYRIPPGYSETYRRSLEQDGVPSSETEIQRLPPTTHGPQFIEDMPPKSSMPKGMPGSGSGMRKSGRGADRSVDMMAPKSSGAKKTPSSR